MNTTSHLKIDHDLASKDDTQVRHILHYGHRETLSVIQHDCTNKLHPWQVMEIKQNMEKQKL